MGVGVGVKGWGVTQGLQDVNPSLTYIETSISGPGRKPASSLNHLRTTPHPLVSSTP